MQRFLDSIGRSDGSVYIGLFRSWKEVAGERIAAHTQPVDVRGHTLIVESDHPAWTQMVMMNRSRILKQLSGRFPELHLTSLAVRLAGSGQRDLTSTPADHTRDHDPTTGDRATAADAPPPSGPAPTAGDPDPTTGEPPHPGQPAGPDPNPAPPVPTADAASALDRIDDPDLRDTLRRLRQEIASADRKTDRDQENDHGNTDGSV
ncbi:MAG: DUF721 domain-containing protein [Spirochaetaceae bacterium]|nr:MAG: DUF721 domain-containing protein [Spirochaetaceae bacterium]